MKHSLVMRSDTAEKFLSLAKQPWCSTILKQDSIILQETIYTLE